MQYFSDEQLDDMFGLLDLGQLEMMGYDNVRQVSNSDELEDLLMTIEEDFSNMDRDEKISELRSIGAFDDDYLVDEVKMGAETKRQRLKREKDEAAMDEASTDVDYMREHYAESKKFYASGASYLGSGSLMDIHKDTGLDAFSPSELTHSSAIHGDFDQASLNYSGHQNIEVRRAEGDLKKMFDQMATIVSDIKCDLCSWQGDNFNYHIAYDCPGTISHRAMLVNAYEKDQEMFGAETFEAASTSPPNLAREKSNLRSAIRSEIDSNFEYNQVVWGPYWVRFEAANSNKWYGILVYNNGKGVFRALGGYGGMGNNPNLVDLATTRSQAQAESAAKRRLTAKERKGYFAYSAESSDAKKPHLPPEAVQKDYENMQKDLNRFVDTLCECKQSKGAPSAVNINTSCGYCGEEIDEVSFYGLTKEAESFEAPHAFGDDRCDNCERSAITDQDMVRMPIFSVGDHGPDSWDEHNVCEECHDKLIDNRDDEDPEYITEPEYRDLNADFEQLSDNSMAVSDRYDVNIGYIVATDGDDDEGDDDVTIGILDNDFEPVARFEIGQTWNDYNPEDEEYFYSEQYYEGNPDPRLDIRLFDDCNCGGKYMPIISEWQCGNCGDIMDPYDAETFAADSPFNTMLLIRQDVIIEEETDFQTLLQIYLDLEADISSLYESGQEKHALLPEMMRYRNQLAARLDEIQEVVEIQDTIEMDAEEDEENGYDGGNLHYYPSNPVCFICGDNQEDSPHPMMSTIGGDACKPCAEAHGYTWPDDMVYMRDQDLGLDAETTYDSTTHIILDQPIRTGFKMGAGWITAIATIPLFILGLGALYNNE